MGRTVPRRTALRTAAATVLAGASAGATASCSPTPEQPGSARSPQPDPTQPGHVVTVRGDTDPALLDPRTEPSLALSRALLARASAVVVGEDLGTVEEGVRETLADLNVLSYRLLWFEDTPPTEYPKKALAAVTTHDLPTLVGIWTGADPEAQRHVGANPDRAGSEKFRSKLLETSGVEAGGDVTEAIIKTFEQLAEAPSMIVLAELEAACLTAERPNMPSACGKYPNWSLALPVTLEELESAELPLQLAQILSRRARGEMHHQQSHSRAG